MVSLEELKQKVNTTEKTLNAGRKNDSISLKQTYNLIEEIVKAGKDFKKTDIDLETTETITWIFVEFIYITNNHCHKWKKEKSHPTEEEFEAIKKQRPRHILDEFKNDVPTVITDKLYSNLEVEVKEIEDFVQQEEKYRKSPSNNDDNNDRNGPNNSDDAKKIANLQNQINQLEAKLRNQPNSETSQQDKEELASLKAELEELKKKKDENLVPTQNNKNNFPTGLVVGGGVVIVILLLVIIVLLGKNKRRQNY